MKRFLSYVMGWRGIALITYMWMILLAWVIVYINTHSKTYLVYLAGVMLFVSLYVCPKILRRAESLSLKTESESFTGNEKRKFFFMLLLASFGIFFAMYITFYPGGFSPDSLDQYAQAVGIKKYNDWHPAIHTLFSFTLPLKISGGWLGSIVLFQIVLASLSLSYMALTLAEYGSRKYAALFLAYILVNPVTLGILMYPWKDVAFAVSAMLSMTFALRVYFSGGKFLRPANIFLFIVFISSATLFRHNAVLFTFPLLLAVLFYAGKKQKAVIVTGCCVFVLAVKFILYPYLGVEKPGYRIVETTCAPMTVIANAVYEAPEKLDSDIQSFIYEVAPKEKWQELYAVGSYNNVKWNGINKNAIEEAGYAKILGMTLRCLKKAPLESLRGFAALTDMVYGICGSVDWVLLPYVHENDYGMEAGGISILQRVFFFGMNVTRVFLKHLFWHIGVMLLIIIIFILAKSDWRKFFLSVPILAYDFGTMLFLGGNDFRFFWCTYLVFPLVLLVLLRDKGEARQ